MYFAVLVLYYPFLTIDYLIFIHFTQTFACLYKVFFLFFLLKCFYFSLKLPFILFNERLLNLTL